MSPTTLLFLLACNDKTSDSSGVEPPDPHDLDDDKDGLSNWDENNKYNTDPHNADTDGDGYSDGDEINKLGTSPTNEFSHPYKAVSYTHLRAHETPEHLVCRLLLEKKK